MDNYTMKKKISNPLLSGIISFILILVIASVGWIIWSNVWKFIILAIGGSAVSSLSPEVQGHFLKEAVEGTFFWIVISTWVWFTLNMGNYGKYAKTTQQPQAGTRYTLWAFLSGIAGFAFFVTFLGLWWEPFSWQVLFRPGSEAQALLAIKGWSAINFFALSVILAQIPLVSVFGKYPFSKYSKEPWTVAIGTLTLGLLLALFN